MPVNKQYFLPLVEEFCKKAVVLGEESYPPHGLFVPYTFEKYEEAPIKIFYVGRDTYGWISFDEMMQDFKNGELDKEEVDKRGFIGQGRDLAPLTDLGIRIWTYRQI